MIVSLTVFSESIIYVSSGNMEHLRKDALDFYNVDFKG